MTIYYKCNMKKQEHILAYIICSLIVGIIAYLFYHLWGISIVIGLLVGIYLEKMYAESTIRKRQMALRMQFRDFLEVMSVAVRAGNVEAKALDSALEDLSVSYNEKADIIKEVKYIIQQYKKGGVELKELFQDFAERSDLEDIRNFATIYSVIAGKSDRFGDILVQTQEIISDKIEIEQEILTTITSAKSETYMMLIMPIIIVVMMSSMGGGLLDTLFTTMAGHLAATVALILFAVSYIIAVKASTIKV